MKMRMVIKLSLRRVITIEMMTATVNKLMSV